MSFTSFFFYIFIALTLLLYFLIPKSRWIVLLIASLVFYATWGLEKLPFILISSWIAYIGAAKITKRNEREGEDLQRIKKHTRWIAAISVILLLLLLFYVKVGTLFAHALSGRIPILVPIGISYYTFSLIGYVLDCYWKKEKAEQNYYKLLLFAAYFPKVLQGPISKHRILAPQLLADHKYDYKSLCYGLQLMLWGYFKKMVIADRLALFVNPVYGDYAHKSGSMLLVATIFGAFQLYCDFFGCMDIAAGFSEILGIKLERNFNHPFFSESASEFWRRWHITLGAWFKDYVYLPMTVAPWMMKLMKRVRDRFGMNAAKNLSAVIPLSVVWILTGLWHGTGWNYVVWGIYWGALIIFGMLLAPLGLRIDRFLHINPDSKEWHLFRKLRTFGLFVISRVLTIPGDLRISLAVFRKMATHFHPWELVDGTIYTMGLNRPNFIAAIIFLLLLLAVSIYEERGHKVRDWMADRQIVFRWILLYGLFFTILIFGIYGPGYDASDFVYMRF